MSDWLWVALIVYGVVAGIWFLFCAIGYWVNSGIYEDQTREAAYWAVRAPLWPWVGGRELGRMIGRMAVDAQRWGSRRGG